MIKICFKLKGWDKEYCFYIYYKLRKFRLKDPLEDPYWLFNPKELLESNKHFEDLIKDNIISEKTIVDIATLGVINELSANFNAKLREKTQALVKESLAEINKQAVYQAKLA